jgi:hypothetical protein
VLLWRQGRECRRGRCGGYYSGLHQILGWRVRRGGMFGYERGMGLTSEADRTTHSAEKVTEGICHSAIGFTRMS